MAKFNTVLLAIFLVVILYQVQAIDAKAPIVDLNKSLIDANTLILDTNLQSLDLNTSIINANIPAADDNSTIIDANALSVGSNASLSDANTIIPDSNVSLIDSNASGAPIVPILDNNSPVLDSNFPLTDTNSSVLDINASLIANNSLILPKLSPLARASISAILPITTIFGLSSGWHNLFTTLSLSCVDGSGGSCALTSFNVNNAGTSDNTVHDDVNGLSHLWSFDNILSGDVVKDSIGSANGTTRYATFVPGHNGNAMLFESGNDPRDLPHNGADVSVGADNNNIIGTGDVSICAWMSLRNIQPNINPHDLNDNTSKLNGITDRLISNGVTIFFVTFGDQPNTYKLNETNNDPLALYPSGSASEIKLDAWQHVCLTRASTGIANFYVDGKPSGALNQIGGGTPTSTPNPNNPNEIVHIGNQQNFDLNKYFDGNLDDVRIYNRVLAPDEINKIYFFGKTWTDGNSIPLNADSNFKMDYFGTDSNGATEIPKTAYYAMDTTPPTMLDLNASVDTNTVHLNFLASDSGGSGIKEYQIRQDLNTPVTSTDGASGSGTLIWGGFDSSLRMAVAAILSSPGIIM